jgi:rfaE bifunctional protein nucleotidyltransferase chain/domain
MNLMRPTNGKKADGEPLMQFDTRNKIKDWNQAAARAAKVREQGGKVVFTNGCFDILHAGHVRYLNEARSLGDFLILGLNSDASVRTLGKAINRPLVAQEQRAEVISALACVDLVCIFEDETPYELIKILQPDVLVKGGDWPPESIVGNDVVWKRGGEVLSIPLVEGLSTTNLVAKIRGD